TPPVRKLALLRPSTTLGRMLLTALIMGVGFAGFESTFSLLGRERVGLTEGSTGLVFAGVGLVLSVVQAVVVKRAIGRFGPKRTAQAAMALNVVGFVLLIPAAGWWALIPALFVLTVGQGLFNPAMSTVVSNVAGPDQRGALFGVQQSVSAFSRVLGPLVALGLFGLNVSLPYVVAAALGIGGLVSLASLRIPTPTVAPPLLPECPAPVGAPSDHSGPAAPTLSTGTRIEGPEPLSHMARDINPPLS
ncbi:MAG: MFS transporter, partial [Acidimicrobiales bacterium]